MSSKHVLFFLPKYMRKQLCPGTKNRQIPTSIYKIIVIGSQAISCKTKSGNNLPCSNPTMLMYIEKVLNVFIVQLVAVIMFLRSFHYHITFELTLSKIDLVLGFHSSSFLVDDNGSFFDNIFGLGLVLIPQAPRTKQWRSIRPK